MTRAEPFHSQHPGLNRRGQQLVNWLRELEECRIGGLVTDEDYAYQRAEKFSALLRPVRGLSVASIGGALLISAIAWAATWHFSHDWRAAGGVAVLAGVWGVTSLGRAFREKCTELQLRGRRRIFLALLENDLLTASEFADFDDRLALDQSELV